MQHIVNYRKRKGDGSINIIVHYPTSDEGRRELKQRVAALHADAVGQAIKELSCPREQKTELLNEIKSKATQY